MLKKILAVVAVSSQLTFIDAQVLDITSPPTEAMDINEYLTLMILAYGDSIDQTKIFGNESEFVPKDALENKNGILWGKFIIRNLTDNELKVVVQVATGLGVGDLEAYVIRAGRLIDTKLTNHFLSGKPRDVPYHYNPHIQLVLPKGSTTSLFLKNVPEIGYPPNFDLKLYSSDTWSSIERGIIIFQSVFQGMLWILFAYNFIVFLQSRDRVFLYYSLYLVTFSLLSAVLFNYFQLLTGVHATATITVLLGISLFVTYIEFFKRFIDADQLGWTWTKVLRRMDKFNLTLFGMGILGTLVFYDHVLVAERILLVLILVFVVTITRLSVISIIRKSLVATYVISGAFFLILGLGIGIYQFFMGNMPSVYPQLGVMGELLVFSLGLGHKMRLAEEDKRIAQIKLVKQLRKNQQLQEQMNEELERLVVIRTDEVEYQKNQVEEKAMQLSIQNEELNKVNSFKDRLFAIIGHDLRNPIKTLEGILGMHTQGRIGTKELEKFISTLTKSVSQVVSLLDNVLMWALQQMDHIKHRPTHINLNELVEANLELLMPQILQKNIGIVNETDKEVRAFADAEMIKLVIRNILSNAIKFSEQGGIIAISTRAVESNIYLDIRDSGIGIPNENIDHLFSLQEVYSTYGTAKEKGTGLGLRLCKDFIEINNGEIYVESQEGEGSTFSISLPEMEPELVG